MRVVVLSPHRDDAAFSCGLTLNRLLSLGAEIAIVNICTISSYAPYLTPDDRDRVAEVTDVRRLEDLAFVDLLLQTTVAEAHRIQLLDLAWQDLPLRWNAADDQALGPYTLLKAEIEAMAGALRTVPAHDLLLAPFALGSHVDHRLVRQAAQQVFEAGSLVFYEDLPYACRTTRAERERLAPEQGTGLCEVSLGASDVSGLKRLYSLCYRSQIAPSVADEMEQYAQQHGGQECFIGAPAALLRLQAALQETLS